LQRVLEELQSEFPGLTATAKENEWRLDVPDPLRTGHEEHFGQVATRFFDYLRKGELPHWEVPNMITKYYLTTHALEMALDE
ncbi:putative oxidoreductase C-terminal domain-containing protein, partial [Balneolaceae bacterium ANBcel3]|nr:putative oxidoreductase C-terminal domain-containing protein [Balneolaceae bacterium ANBcel3]